MAVTSSDNAASTTLASAGTELLQQEAPNFAGSEVVRTKALGGADLNGGDLDGFVNVNWGQPWEISANTGDIDGTEFDFFSTIFHELAHSLGFASVMDAFGNALFPNEYAAFDEFVMDVNGNPVVTAGFMLNGTVYVDNIAGGPSPAAGLFFGGANARAANGGNAVGLYTPNPFQDGSSGSHLDDDNPALALMMMASTTDTGPGARTLSAIECGIFADLGYTCVGNTGPGPDPIPEPSTWLLLGTGVLALAWRRRRA